MKPGDLVGHLAPNRAPRLALITEVLNGKVRLDYGTNGSSAKSTPLRELSLISSANEEHSNLDQALRSQPLVPHLLATAWQEAVSRADFDKALNLTDFCHLLRSQPDLSDRASAWLALHGNQDLFRLRRDEIVPRRAEELKTIRKERRRAHLRDHQERQNLQRLAQRQPLDWNQSDSSTKRVLDKLERLAAADDPAQVPLDQDISQALKTAGFDGSLSSLQTLLVDLELLNPGQPLTLFGSAWHTHFPEDCLRQVETLLDESQSFPGDESRKDLTALRCFAIDSADTREVDDAIGIERRPDGNWIWIHIADPHRLIPPGSPLDLEARRRGSTLYLSGGLQPMLPLALAAGPLSLLPGRRQPAVSLAVQLNDYGEIISIESCRSWIKVSYRLSYEDADDLIELAPPEDPDLGDLHLLLEGRRRWRQTQGALLMDQAEGRLFRKNETGHLQLEISEPSPARLLVAEAMVLAGAAMAEWCNHHGLPMPYRGQPCGDAERMVTAERFAEGPVRWAHQRGALSRSRTSCVAEPHQSLGLQAYLQWTSPIRRYGDLLAHRQWLAQQGLLQPDATPMSSDELSPLLEKSDQLSREASLIARQDQRQALLQWLEEDGPGPGPHTSILLRWLREDLQLALVRVDAWAMDLPARVEGSAAPGDAIVVQVSEVSSANDVLRLTATSC